MINEYSETKILSDIIYLDNAATVQPYQQVLQNFVDTNSSTYYNPMASYPQAAVVHKAIEQNKQSIADTLCVDKDTLYFTSGATESNNWALTKGHKQKQASIVTSVAEHESVLTPINQLKNSGSNTIIIPLDSIGRVDLQQFAQLIANHPISLVSVIHVCGQTGAINDIQEIVKLTKKQNPNALVHSDGVQAFGKIEYNLQDLGVDLYTLSLHKLGGLKGLGLLYIKKGIHLAPFLFGGTGGYANRAGTPNTPAILSSGLALGLYQSKSYQEYQQMRQMAINILQKVDNTKINGNGIPHILNVSFEGIKAEVLQNALSDKVIIGIGSACNPKHTQNQVLQSMGLSKQQIQGSIRISFGPHNTTDQVKKAAEYIATTVNQLRTTSNNQ